MSNVLALPPPTPLPSDDLAQQQRERMELIKLATDIAREHEPLETTLARKGITNIQYEEILKNPFYQRVLTAQTEAWHAPQNAETRIRLQGQFLFEHAMLEHYIRITDKNEPLSAVNEGMKVLMKAAGIGDRVADQATGEKFVISINLGAGQKIEHEMKTIEAQPEPGAAAETK